MREEPPPDDEMIFDAHGHIGHEGSMGIARMQLPYIDADGLGGTMDRLGIDRCIVSTWSGITHGDPASNDITLRAIERYPNRLLGYGTVNPRYLRVGAEEMRRVFRNNRMVGYKPYPPRRRVPPTDGSPWPPAEALVSSCRRWGNIYAEITYTSILYGLVEYLVREPGRGRVLFGTDCVMRDAAAQPGWAPWARIPFEDKRVVPGGNIAGITGI